MLNIMRRYARNKENKMRRRKEYLNNSGYLKDANVMKGNARIAIKMIVIVMSTIP